MRITPSLNRTVTVTYTGGHGLMIEAVCGRKLPRQPAALLFPLSYIGGSPDEVQSSFISVCERAVQQPGYQRR